MGGLGEFHTAHWKNTLHNIVACSGFSETRHDRIITTAIYECSGFWVFIPSLAAFARHLVHRATESVNWSDCWQQVSVCLSVEWFKSVRHVMLSCVTCDQLASTRLLSCYASSANHLCVKRLYRPVHQHCKPRQFPIEFTVWIATCGLRSLYIQHT